MGCFMKVVAVFLTLFGLAECAATLHPVEVTRPITDVVFYEVMAGERGGTLDAKMNDRVGFSVPVRNTDSMVTGVLAEFSFADAPNRPIEAVSLTPESSRTIRTSNPQVIAQAKDFGVLKLVVTLYSSRVPTLDHAFRNVTQEFLDGVIKQVKQKVSGGKVAPVEPVYYYIQTTVGGVSVLRMPAMVIFPPRVCLLIPNQLGTQQTCPWLKEVKLPVVQKPELVIKSSGQWVGLGCTSPDLTQTYLRQGSNPANLPVFSLPVSKLTSPLTCRVIDGLGADETIEMKVNGKTVTISSVGGLFVPGVPGIPDDAKVKEDWIPVRGEP